MRNETVNPVMREILNGLTPAIPDLTGRMSMCLCGKKEPSSPNLFGFVYQGPGSQMAEIQCKRCGYYDCAHGTYQPHLSRVCKNFEPRGPWDTDTHYCGCRGWD
jgi:hypothetical protein